MNHKQGPMIDLDEGTENFLGVRSLGPFRQIGRLILDGPTKEDHFRF